MIVFSFNIPYNSHNSKAIRKPDRNFLFAPQSICRNTLVLPMRYINAKIIQNLRFIPMRDLLNLVTLFELSSLIPFMLAPPIFFFFMLVIFNLDSVSLELMYYVNLRLFSNIQIRFKYIKVSRSNP